MIEREENTVYIATISYGKDSTTMCDLILKNKLPIDEIIFTDTLEEFDEMYEYAKKVNKYLFERYKIKVTNIKPKSTFNDWAYGKITRGERRGMTRGLPAIDGGVCFWRREAKVKPMESYIKNKYKNKTIVFYIGYTLGENRSVKEKWLFKYIYPLQDIFKMTEKDCKEYLINQEMENPLYRHFTRTGCAMCPFQSEKSYYEIYNNYPKVWQKMKERESYLLAEKKCVNPYWFTNYRTTKDMESIFNKKSTSLFDFSDEPVKDCFCKI